MVVMLCLSCVGESGDWSYILVRDRSCVGGLMLKVRICMNS